MPHILVAGKIHEAGLERLRNAPGVTFDLVEEVSTESYAPLLEKADGLLIRTQPMTSKEVALGSKLKVVSRHGVGFDSVDVKALNERGIPLAIVGDVNSGAVAEHALMMMLAVAKQALHHDAGVRGGNWNCRNAFSATELAGRTLLLLGFGRIGQGVANLALPFGMRVAVFDPYQSDDFIREKGCAPVATIDEGLPEADFVSVHMPLIDGKALLGERELALMKASAIVVNTARGGIIDEQALCAALKEGRLGGAGLDVLVDEPPKAEDPLLDCPRVLLSPHVAGLTQEAAMRMSVSAVENILKCFSGDLDPVLVVNAQEIGFS
ncbi:2-hydroxyacid dehydrogenase [Marinobacterium nitratireducens]|uniref:2-hydroxyacid dehydrogenase n=1 Tax=Marinobacterium nitratireducens TaxID=518897 RepID=A0A918DV03_9GAMM|nr:hydroxyacid dehydrogenase [Marinobacterium nitratireducens]GGO84386.1 2-hydroxyacid dehydrogenase [Marinobacterium nitratireducens]